MREKTYRKKLHLFAGLLLMVVCVPVAGGIIYVDDDAAGANNGTSWADAYTYLQDALADANTADKPVEIRVAQGVYKPDRGAGITPGNPGATFQLRSGVAVRGGFAGAGAVEPNARDIQAYPTILSGDLSGDDADVADPADLSDEPTRTENSYRVVTGSRTDDTAVLDGVTVTAGSIDMANDYGDPTVANCTFTKARTAMDNWHGNPRLTNCTFKGNWLYGIDSVGGSLTLTDCLFTDNSRTAVDSGFGAELTLSNCTFTANSNSAIEYHDGNMTLSGCLFSGNSSASGAGIRGYGGNMTVHDCIFEGNIASGGGGAISCVAENLSLYNCQFRANVSSRAGALDAGASERLIVENCAFTGNVGGAIRRRFSGPTVISNCLFAGNRGAAIQADGPYNFVRNCTFSGNFATDGGSALDAWQEPRVSNCIFWANSSPAIRIQHGQPAVVDYCNVQGGWPGEGNIDLDPCFVEPGRLDPNGTPEDGSDDFWVDGDYHLRSQAGRWDPAGQTWAQDDVTSPCIDAGDPNSAIGTEPFPNGGRVNLGAYGASDEASKTYFGGPVCDTIIAGDINGDCVVDFDDLAILVSHWMMSGEDFVNKAPTVTLIAPKDGDQIAWPGPTIFRAEAYDVDGEVRQVMFNVQQVRDGGSHTSGFSGHEGPDAWEREYYWPNEPGNWTVWAEATDNEGSVGVSPQIAVTLYRP